MTPWEEVAPLLLLGVVVLLLAVFAAGYAVPVGGAIARDAVLLGLRP